MDSRATQVSIFAYIACMTHDYYYPSKTITFFGKIEGRSTGQTQPVNYIKKGRHVVLQSGPLLIRHTVIMVQGTHFT